MRLTVLSVGYAFAAVGADAVGGAEQILSQLDLGLTRAGHHSIVVAREDSQVAGTHVRIPLLSGPLDPHTVGVAHNRLCYAIDGALNRWPVDVVHLHAIDFSTHLPRPGVPTLATLHLPVDWYPPDALRPIRPDTWFNCVSQSQHAACRRDLPLLPPIENGVAEHFFSTRHSKRNFALMLARICPEKGIHLAIAAAKRAGIALLIAGAIFPHETHQRYFRDEVAPRLDAWRRFIGPAGLARKRRLLAAARCVLVPTLVSETSSLVVREALASGTPVIAFARGGPAEIIEHGRTGFLVHNEQEMAEAIARSAEIDPQACRSAARARFSLERMIEQYIATYERLSRSKCRGVIQAAS